MRGRSRGIRALTLLVVIAAAGAAVAGPAEQDALKRARTRELMQLLLSGIFGGGNSVGYLGDMGAAPASLADLAAASGSPAYSSGNAGGVGMGYGGPYVSRPGASAASFVDAWGSPLAIEATAGALRLRSAGPDRDPATQADNVYLPLEPRTTHGGIEVEVTAMTFDGAVAGLLDATEVAVSVYFAAAGSEATAAATYAAGTQTFTRSGVHLGRHYVRASALTPTDFSVASADQVVWLKGRTVRAQLRLVLAEGGGTLVCHDPAGPSPETQTVTSSALSAHLAHGDVAGACAGTGEPEPEASDLLVCHSPGNNPQTKTVSADALAAHLGHGDTPGACPSEPEEDPESEDDSKKKKKKK